MPAVTKTWLTLLNERPLLGQGSVSIDMIENTVLSPMAYEVINISHLQ